jgi:hypothetical protein
LSFQRLARANPETRAAENVVQSRLTLPAYRIEVYKHGEQHRHPADVRKVRVEVRERATLLVDGAQVLLKREAAGWRAVADA